MNNNYSLVEDIREISRKLVRELGFMGGRFAGTDLSPSTVHALIEIEKGNITASKLAFILRLEKSSISRMLRKLKDHGYVSEKAKKDDSRAKVISLSASGKKCVKEIHQFARKQVGDALDHLKPNQEYLVLNGLAIYSNALAENKTLPISQKIDINKGYSPGLIGQITQLHSLYYSRESGFGQHFESVVASGLASFCARPNSSKNRIWTATLNDEIVGSIAIDGEDIGNNIAHLRWFIVSDKVRAMGVGKRLLDMALHFVDNENFTETHLWTFSDLSTARHLYEKRGFSLKKETLGTQWGKKVLEQKFVRNETV